MPASSLRLSRLASVALTFALASFSPRAGADESRVTFPFHDDEYLFFGESRGGAVYLAEQVGQVGQGESVPLVVVLHGVNTTGALHPWLGGRGLPDLTPLAAKLVRSGRVRPFVIAAPTQTRGAMAGRRMWQGFDLAEFVDAVDGALAGRAVVTRREIIVIGHSGAGCNADGGLLGVAARPGRLVPYAIVAVDTCLDEASGTALGASPHDTRLFVAWQRVVWPRSIDRFLTAFHAASRPTGRDDPTLDLASDLAFDPRSNPHEQILVRTFEALLPDLLPDVL
jgi:hypothetical protein